MYNSTKIYKPITGWKKVKNGEFMGEDGRDAVKLAIGERIGKDEKKSYISVPIWKDMLKLLLSDPKSFSVYVAPGGYPQLYIKQDHGLCVYNAEMAELISFCKEQLQNVESDILCNAIAEYRTAKRVKKEDEPNIEKITAMISEKKGRPVLHEFVASVICDFFNEAYTEGDPTAQTLTSLSYEELKVLALDSIFLEMTGTYPDKERENFLKEMEIEKDDLSAAIQDELFRRLITGRIVGA